MRYSFNKTTRTMEPFILIHLKSIIFKKNRFRHRQKIPPPRQKNRKNVQNNVQNIFLMFNYD